MNRNRRVAIAGLGPMGRRHLKVLELLQDIELVAVADTRPETLTVDLGDGVRKYTDAATMFAECRPDTIILATNAPSHHSLALRAITCGARAIFCEKPISCSIAEAEEMIVTAREHGCALAVNHGRRHVPAYKWLAAKLQSGEWGELRSVQSNWPGVGLGCLATHMVDLWRFLTGEELTTVHGWVDPVRGSNPRGSNYRDPGGMIIATTASSARYIHEQAEDGAGPPWMVIATTGAQIVVDEHRGSIQILTRDLSVKPGPGHPPGYVPVQVPPEAPFTLDIFRLSGESLRELVDGSDVTCSAEHGLRSLEVIVAAHLSSQIKHGPVALPITDSEAKKTWLPIT